MSHQMVSSRLGRAVTLEDRSLEPCGDTRWLWGRTFEGALLLPVALRNFRVCIPSVPTQVQREAGGVLRDGLAEFLYFQTISHFLSPMASPVIIREVYRERAAIVNS